jgi:putative pyruvate formate lyase activating enzyme
MKVIRTAGALRLLRLLQSPCRLCPRSCGARRAEGELGVCGVGSEVLVASAGPHSGEEACLVGHGGSGTIFLGGCNLLCRFCQNAETSHGREGTPASPEAVARLMRRLEDTGCENVNFVTPTHVAPSLAEAIARARAEGLEIPVVWNCGGYESVEALRALEGLVEIYMPDLKTLDADFAGAAFDAPDYPDRAREAIREMQRQVGDLVLEDGVAARGLLVRHLVMPGMGEDTRRVLDFLAREVSPRAFVNVMGQYRPCYRAGEIDGLDLRRPTVDEIGAARRYAAGLGLRLGHLLP